MTAGVPNSVARPEAQAISVLQVLAALHRTGPENVVMEIMRWGRAKGYAMDVCLTTSGPIGEHTREVIDMGCEILMCDLDRLTLDFRRNFARLLSRKAYDAVHVHMGPLSGLALGVAACAGVPIRIAHYHGTLISAGLPLRLACAVGERMVDRHATDRVAVSGGTARLLFGRRALNDRRMHIIHNPVDPAPLRRGADRDGARAELGLPHDALVLGHVGRFGLGKNQAVVVRVASALAGSHPVKVLLVGDGPDRPAVEALTRDFGLRGTVRFVGARADVGRLLSAMDLFIFPSSHEGFGIAAVEAQLCGLPVIAYDVPGLDEAVCHPDLLVPPGDEAALARVVAGLCSEPARRIRLGAEAARWAERFSPDRITPAFFELYEEGARHSPRE
jgi:glycosyltransferase involved in cell wall biosynthesis